MQVHDICTVTGLKKNSQDSVDCVTTSYELDGP
jgi:hypothetical protein